MKAAHDEGVLVCYYEPVMGDTYADFTGGNDFYEIGQLITKTIGDMNITGNVAYIYGDSTGGTGVVKFQEGMLDQHEELRRGSRRRAVDHQLGSRDRHGLRGELDR